MNRLSRRSIGSPLAALIVLGLLPAAVSAAPSPVAAADSVTVPVNAATTSVDVLANDTGTGLTITAVTIPGHGTATIDAGAIDYAPAAAFHGIDTFDYTITDASSATSSATVTVIVNDPPVAVDDPGVPCGATSNFGGAFPIPEDYRGNPNDFVGTGVSNAYFVLFGNCSPLANDTDPNGDPLTWQILTQPAHGNVVKFDESFFGYKPDPDWSTKAGDLPGGQWVSDSFTYRAFDGLSYSQPATMRYWVAPVNDVPTFTPGASVTVDEGSGAYSGQWATNVSPGPPNESDQTVHFELDGPSPIRGQAAGLFTVLPAIDRYGVLTFTLAPHANGFAYVQMVLKDDGGLESYSGIPYTQGPRDTTDPFWFYIYVTSVNDPPAGTDRSTAVFDNDFATLQPSDFGFTDPDDNPANSLAAVRIATLPAAGSLSDDGLPVTAGEVIPSADITAGRLSYVPVSSGNVVRHDAFTFQVQDDGGTAHGGVDLDPTPNTLTLDVYPVEDPPTAVDDTVVVAPDDGATPIDVLANDSDADGDTITILAVTNGVHGTVAITGGGTGLTYDPATGYTGPDSFTYTIMDPAGRTSTATVFVTVTSDTVAPVVLAPAQRFPGQTVGTSTIRTRLAWSASDPGSGVRRYDLQASVNGGGYATVALASPTASTVDRALTEGATYRFRVRATDTAGNTSDWQYGAAFKAAAYQESTSLATFTGSWSTHKTASALGGAVKVGYSPAASARFHATAYDFGLVVTKSTTGGQADIYVDGVLAGRISLHATRTTYRQLVFARHFATLGSHTIEVRPVGNGRVDVDAFTVLR